MKELKMKIPDGSDLIQIAMYIQGKRTFLHQVERIVPPSLPSFPLLHIFNFQIGAIPYL